MMETIPQIFFFLFAAVAVAGALGVVLQRGPLQSALSLIVCFAAFAGSYVMLNAQFIAAIQIIVYAGAIIVLFVFVIMLLAVRVEGGRVERNKLVKYLTVPAAFAMFAIIIYRAVYPMGVQAKALAYDPARSMAVGTVESIGAKLFTDYLVPFEATSVLILMAIVGSMVLARRAMDDEGGGDTVETPEEILGDPEPVPADEDMDPVEV